MTKKYLYISLFLISVPLTSLRATMGVANLTATSTNTLVSGTVLLEDTKEGLKVKANILNATPGKHGFHIHEFGNCTDMGKAAGSHYNPKGTPHGHIMKDGMAKAHAGDLGNIEIGADGTGSLEAVIPGLTLTNGQLTVGGRAFVFHEKQDDFGQPVGNAGGRLGCGIIVVTGN